MGAYQLKVTIKGSKPPIWRRVLVPQGITFVKLHQMIQTAFCWSDEHLYEFEFRS
ncbi:MAG: plasmid pRiA4b ORF-3 family protein, partial [Lacrimispora sphenoides]